MVHFEVPSNRVKSKICIRLARFCADGVVDVGEIQLDPLLLGLIGLLRASLSLTFILFRPASSSEISTCELFSSQTGPLVIFGWRENREAPRAELWLP